MRAILFSLLLVGAQAQASDGSAVHPPIVRIVHPATSSPGLRALVPPAPPTVKQSVSFPDDGSDLYSCGNGFAVNYASTYREFEDRHRAAGMDEGDAYSQARPLNIPGPEFPADLVRTGYVSVMVAVSKDGRVADSMLVCSTDSVFDEYVAKAVKSATFKPASSHGVAVGSIENIEYWMPRF